MPCASGVAIRYGTASHRAFALGISPIAVHTFSGLLGMSGDVRGP
nr:hypothetical protein [Kibdelosporangium sp. MJ126-NF4]CTQ88566.1 hypothetical protein [Kibdelosporangium sp. MJ126-NF4]